MLDNIEDVIRNQSDELMKIPGVVGVGEGKTKGRPCIVIFVLDKGVNSLKSLPETLEGYPLIIEESGDFLLRG